MKRIIFILALLGILFPVAQKAVALERHPPFLLSADRRDEFGGDIQEQWNALLRDLEKLEKEAERKMRQDIVPYLKKEIERLREWLREFELKEKPREPDRTWT
jgi:5'-deoxynucleotidase YfbR-like HD superfamily hydrolase